MNKSTKELYKRSDDDDRIKLLKDERESLFKILKSSPDINQIRHVQGQVHVLDIIISALG